MIFKISSRKTKRKHHFKMNESLERNGVLGNIVQQIQPNTVIRGVESGSLQFITVPRTRDQEFIDHSLLSPGYITTQMQNGLVVDLLPASQSEQTENDEMQTQTIFSINEQHHQASVIERQYLNDMSVEDSLVTSIPKHLEQSQQTQQQQQQQHIFIPSNSMNGKTEENENGNIDERNIIGSSNRPAPEQFYQYFSKENPPIMMNGTHVIVSNKEMATITPIEENNFLNSIDSNNQLMNQPILSTNSPASNAFENKLNNNQRLLNTSVALPPLPPLARISTLHSNRRSNPQQNGQFKFVTQDTRDLQKPEVNFLKTATEDDRTELNGTNGSLGIRQQNNGIISMALPAPKKNLPHKKRITKKLRNINQQDEQMQSNIAIHQSKQMHQTSQQMQSTQAALHYQNQQQAQDLNEFQQQLQAHEVQSLQQHSQIIQQTGQNENKSSLYTNQMDNLMIVQQFPAINSNSQVKVKPLITLQSAQNTYSCELCGNQSRNQYEFFAHLKSHYEPTASERSQKQDDSLNENMVNNQHLDQLQSNEQIVTSAEQLNMSSLNLSQLPSNIATSLGSSMIIHQNQQDLYDVTTSSNSNENRNVISELQPSVVNDRFNTNITSDLIEEMSGMNEDCSRMSDGRAHETGSMVHYSHSIKTAESEFSDTEDMLDGDVVDKVQNTVDNYIENNSNDVKDIINLNEGIHHTHSDGEPQHELNGIAPMTEESVCNKVWANLTDNAQYPDVDIPLDKSEDVDSSQQFSLDRNLEKHTNTVIERIPATSTTEEMTVIYEIDINDKDFYVMQDNGNPSILRRQLLKTEEALMNSNHQISNSLCDSLPYTDESQYNQEVTVSKEEYSEQDSDKLNDIDLSYNYSIRDIQEEFIEEEEGDTETNAANPSSTKKRKLYRCRQCNKLCNSKNAFHYHFLSHTGQRPHQCEICGKSFFASSALNVHKRLHSGDKPYECDFCGRPFRQWGDLKYHIQSRHTAEKNHQCEFCGKDFARRYSLVVHRRIHTGEKNYKCEHCDKEFRASSYLQVHRKIHTGEKPHTCEICGKKFRVRGDMKRHLNVHERKTKESLHTESNTTENSASIEAITKTKKKTSDRKKQSLNTPSKSKNKVNNEQSVGEQNNVIISNSKQKSKRKQQQKQRNTAVTESTNVIVTNNNQTKNKKISSFSINANSSIGQKMNNFILSADQQRTPIENQTEDDDFAIDIKIEDQTI